MDIMKSLANKISLRGLHIKESPLWPFSEMSPNAFFEGSVAWQNWERMWRFAQRHANPETREHRIPGFGMQNPELQIWNFNKICNSATSEIWNLLKRKPESKNGSHQKGRCDSCILKDKNVLLTQFSTFETNDPAHKTTGMGNHPPRPSTHQTFPTQEAACHWTELGC